MTWSPAAEHGPPQLPLPEGPGSAALIGTDPDIHRALTRLGWQVYEIPAPTAATPKVRAAATGGSVDLTVIDHVLTALHNADKRAVIADVARWMRPGGLVIVREPFRASRSRWGPWTTLRQMLHAPPSDGPATVEFYETALHDAGFPFTAVIDAREEVVVLVAHTHERGGSPT